MQFWWFAIKYATQVYNYMPINYKEYNNYTTLPRLQTEAWLQKPVPYFSVAYVKHYKDGTKKRKKLKSQTIKCIVVGNDHKSDGRLFYVPKTKHLIGSADYVIDHIPPAGPVFGLKYDGHVDF